MYIQSVRQVAPPEDPRDWAGWRWRRMDNIHKYVCSMFKKNTQEKTHKERNTTNL